MLKPKYGYDHEQLKDFVNFPLDWKSSQERRTQFQSRRVFFEVQLFDWTIRHDLLGDGSILKTIVKRGTGYDRPDKYDQIVVNLKISQGDNLFFD